MEGDLIRSNESVYDESTGILLFSAMTDYEKSIGKFKFSTGAKYSYINTENQLAYYNIENDIPAWDTSRSNDFSYLEKVVAAYLILNANLTERITVNAGLRVENTTSLGELTSAVPTPDDVVARNYTDLFPNISISYNDNENHALSLSYGRRITRPDYQNLNPFEVKLSEISAWRGIPSWNPIISPIISSPIPLNESWSFPILTASPRITLPTFSRSWMIRVWSSSRGTWIR